MKTQAIKNDKINRVYYKTFKIKKCKKCARCGWLIEGGTIATQWNNINIFTHIKCEH